MKILGSVKNSLQKRANTPSFSVSYLGVTFIIFAESGLLVGFFLPGDSLLFTAGFLASQGFFNIVTLTTLTFIAAVAGDSVGYAIGRKVGPKVFVDSNSKFFNPQHVARSRAFFVRHGGKTIILARFIPIVRTFAPVLAGVGQMNYRSFLAYNLIGGLLWGIGVTWLGYYLGNVVPNIDKYLWPIISLIIVTSLLPSVGHWFFNRIQKIK